jgi:multidrug transporter EmrE-like cation transporter
MFFARLREEMRKVPITIREWFLWLSVRDTPRSWFSGSYSLIKLVRFSMVFFALVNFAAIALGNPAWNVANLYSLWLGFADAGFILVSVIYLFGLRMWYAPVSLFLIVSGVINYKKA